MVFPEQWCIVCVYGQVGTLADCCIGTFAVRYMKITIFFMRYIPGERVVFFFFCSLDFAGYRCRPRSVCLVGRRVT